MAYNVKIISRHTISRQSKSTFPYKPLFFRGVLYGWLRARLGVFFSIGLSAALFSLAHMIAQSFVPILILGVVLAIIFERSGSLWPGIMVHGIHNTAIIAVLYTVSGAQLT